MRGSSSRRIVIIVVAVLAVAVVAFLAIGLLAPNSWPGQVLQGSAIESGAQPTYGNMIVDGNPGEWDLANDFFADMYLAANPTKQVLSKLYLRYDCDSNTLGVLVLVEPGHTIEASSSGDNHFVKINDSKAVDANYVPADGAPPPDFAWIGLSPDGNTAAGWEAAITLYPGTHDLNVHSNVDNGDTSAVDGRSIELTIDCDPTAVFLNYFTAEWVGSKLALSDTGKGTSVLLRWETSSEIDNLGFNVYRAASVEGPWTKLNREIIPSNVPPGSITGSYYEYTDPEVPAERTVYYMLEDVENTGVTTQHGPVSPR
jgi:hypothetical protein